MGNNKMGFCVKSLKSFFGYLTARPPIAIFILFIAGCSLSFVSLAYYIQHHDDIIDYEATKEYLNVMKKFSRIPFCLTHKTKQLNKTERQTTLVQHGATEFINISIPLRVSFSLQGNLTYAKAIMQITGIVPYYYILTNDNHIHNIGLEVFLSEPLIPEKCKGKVQHVTACVTITIKKTAVPVELPHPTCQPGLPNGNSSVVHMGAISPSTQDKQALCLQGLQMKINYDGAYIPSVYLNLIDKAKVNLRLNTTSYVLFFILLACILYTIIRGNAMNATMKVIQS